MLFAEGHPPVDELGLLATMGAYVGFRREERALDAGIIEILLKHRAQTVVLVLADLPGVDRVSAVIANVSLGDDCVMRGC